MLLAHKGDSYGHHCSALPARRRFRRAPRDTIGLVKSLRDGAHMELNTWTHDKLPEFARTFQGTEAQETTGEELACHNVPDLPHGNRCGGKRRVASALTHAASQPTPQDWPSFPAGALCISRTAGWGTKSYLKYVQREVATKAASPLSASVPARTDRYPPWAQSSPAPWQNPIPPPRAHAAPRLPCIPCPVPHR